MFRRISPLLKLVIWIVALYVVFDFLVIRTGFYFRYTEPESIAGSVLQNSNLLERRLDPVRDNIIVVGDSQVGEGFSAKIANELAKDTKLNFIGCGISGSTPRVWHYFLRQIDPKRQKFAAVILMTTALTDEEIVDDFINYKPDPNYCLPLLDWTDLWSFPSTFSKPDLRERARRSIAFPLIFIQNDIKALLTHPLERTRKAKLWHDNYPDWIYGYPARSEALPPLELTGNPARPRNWDGIREAVRPQLEGYFSLASDRYPHPPLSLARDYRKLWYGKIARDYQAKGIPVYVFLMPRGPYHVQLARPTALTGSLAELSSDGSIHFLAPQPFTALEVPGNFFDQLHLNAIGRAKLTDLLAHVMMELLSPSSGLSKKSDKKFTYGQHSPVNDLSP